MNHLDQDHVVFHTHPEFHHYLCLVLLPELLLLNILCQNTLNLQNNHLLIDSFVLGCILLGRLLRNLLQFLYRLKLHHCMCLDSYIC